MILGATCPSLTPTSLDPYQMMLSRKIKHLAVANAVNTEHFFLSEENLQGLHILTHVFSWELPTAVPQ